MKNRKRMQSGFTLVEILIVVVILGILAAIVIPQFTNASEDAKASTVLAQLHTMRSQLELYRVQHDSVYPDLVVKGWSAMYNSTDKNGTVHIDGSGKYGPYLQQAPKNPFTATATNTVINAAAIVSGTATTGVAGVAWIYDKNNGKMKAVITTAASTSLGLIDTEDFAIVP